MLKDLGAFYINDNDYYESIKTKSVFKNNYFELEGNDEFREF